MLANAYGVDQGEVYSMISKGQIAGQDAARIILDALTDSFAGSMERQSKTFSGITSTIEGLRQELVRLTLIAEPEADRDLMARVADRLEEAELLELSKVYRERADRLLFPAVQLRPREAETDRAGAEPFRI